MELSNSCDLLRHAGGAGMARGEGWRGAGVAKGECARRRSPALPERLGFGRIGLQPAGLAQDFTQDFGLQNKR